jgi:hypothetical protein
MENPLPGGQNYSTFMMAEQPEKIMFGSWLRVGVNRKPNTCRRSLNFSDTRQKNVTVEVGHRLAVGEPQSSEP